MINSTSDAGIPLLTEILVMPTPAPETTLSASYAAAMIPVAPAITPPAPEFDASVDFDIPALTPERLSDAVSPSPSPLSTATVSQLEWQQLEADITDRISRQVLNRIDFVLEQRVRDSLADVLQIAVEGLAKEIKRGLHHTLEDVIGRAVAQEVARLQTSKK
jgi:hypothetical protein